MADLIDYPANKVKPDCLPRRGDHYEAFGLALKPRPALCFVFPDWSITALPYASAGMSCFRPLDNADGRGECVISLVFAHKLAGWAVVVVIEGRNLLDFYQHVCEQRVSWLWALPEDAATVGDGSPAVHSLAIREADDATLQALLAD